MTNTQTRPAGNGVGAPSVSAERSHWTLVAVALATSLLREAHQTLLDGGTADDS